MESFLLRAEFSFAFRTVQALCIVLASLPAPVNVSVISVNFHHVLRWDPGPGTPPGTQYMISKRLDDKRRLNSTTTSLKLKLKNYYKYHLNVQAYYNQTWSPVSNKYTFSPFKDSPPKVSLAGCGNCIQINMSLPEADRSSGINDIQKFFTAYFRIFCRRGKETVGSYKTQNKSFTLDNLNRGTEYCVQVHTEISQNKNTEPSYWKCTFTSIMEPRRDPLILGAGAALLIVVMGVPITFVFCLYYTGFLCKLKALPTTLTALSQGYTLTPEGTISDPVSISPQIGKERKHNKNTKSLPATGNEEEEEEEDDEEEINVYIGKTLQFPSGESLCWGSGNVLQNSEPATSPDCGSLTVRLSAEVEVSDAEFDGGVTHGVLDKDGAKAEGAKVSFMTEERHIRLQEHFTDGEEVEQEEEIKKKEEFVSSGNVNLLSVTLAALSVGKEEDEEQNAKEPLSNFLKLSDLEPLQTVQKQTLSNTVSQTESEDQTAVGLVQHTHEDFTETGYEGVHADTSGCIESQHEEEEVDDDNFIEYMAHT
ncbi:interferon lambda receptor 1 isoform X2 [Scophthalmus maximus]|uniref:interferon lambda receptor 1 isoform X2 n=1 Tax=Scophthalmus maximus TaxID=52904 RepID=UPI001FA82F88|nr:interferon lambda receptor 1 isoform X2 [Scophthalmus maximus]